LGCWRGGPGASAEGVAAAIAVHAGDVPVEGGAVRRTVAGKGAATDAQCPVERVNGVTNRAVVVVARQFTAVDRHGPGVGGGAASAAGPVVGQGDAGNLHRGAVVVVDGPAVAQIVVGAGGVVAGQDAAGDLGRAAVVDGAAGVGVVVRQD